MSLHFHTPIFPCTICEGALKDNKKMSDSWDNGSLYLKYIARRKSERLMGNYLNRTNRERGGSMGPTKYPRECPVSRFPGLRLLPSQKDKAVIFPFLQCCLLCFQDIQFFVHPSADRLKACIWSWLSPGLAHPLAIYLYLHIYTSFENKGFLYFIIRILAGNLGDRRCQHC